MYFYSIGGGDRGPAEHSVITPPNPRVARGSTLSSVTGSVAARWTAALGARHCCGLEGRNSSNVCSLPLRPSVPRCSLITPFFALEVCERQFCEQGGQETAELFRGSEIEFPRATWYKAVCCWPGHTCVALRAVCWRLWPSCYILHTVCKQTSKKQL
jgi:hypothetical protein